MDPREVVPMDGGAWTEERHSNFLSRMEESFVRRMLAGDADLGLHRRPPNPPPPPLDRCLPHSVAESTLDSRSGNSRARRSPTTAANQEIEIPVGVVRGRMRKLRPPPQYDKTSQDQVVPQLEENSTDENKRKGKAGVLTLLPTNHD